MLELDSLLAAPPKLHKYQGQLISDWRIDDPTCRKLGGLLKPEMETLETGAGLSTIIFAASGCKHTCVMPDRGLADRIQDYCREAGIDASNIRFIVSKSCDAIHQLQPLGYDLALIDGCHGFPSIFVDFYYASKALKIGGVLILDDMHIYTCHLTALFMQSDAGWKTDLVTDRFVVGIKLSDTIDGEWVNQPFVVARSRNSAFRNSAFKNPLSVAKLTAQSLVTHGVSATANKIFKRLLVGKH